MSGTVAECYCITHLRILISYNFICTVVQNFNEVDLKCESVGLLHLAQTMVSSSDFYYIVWKMAKSIHKMLINFPTEFLRYRKKK